MLMLSLLACGLTFFVPIIAQWPGTKNMNGRYSVASGAKQRVDFNTDYASKGHEYFDVWAPEIATHYSQVFWTSQGTQPLPDAIIKRFAGKVIAITGYEQDQVMVDPVGHPGVNPDKDVSVPINWAYNHHYMAWMVGNYSSMVEVKADAEDVSAHGSPTKWVARDTANAKYRRDTDIPTNQMFSEGNGGESRRSFHGYPDGFAQLIESPEGWHITPMQIDTRNRDCGVKPADVNNCTQFVPGPEPKQARYGRGIPKGTNHSGVLECPCNSRFGGDPGYYPNAHTKEDSHHYIAINMNVCSQNQQLTTASSCFESALSLGVNSTSLANKTISDKSLPSGCSVKVNSDGSGTVYFNSIKSGANCSSSESWSGQLKSAVGVTVGLKLKADAGPVTFQRSSKGKYCSKNHQGVMGKFVMANATTGEAVRARNQCEAFCGKNKHNCWGCSVDCSLGTMTRCQWVAIPECGAVTAWAGLIEGDITQKRPGGVATITLSGPDHVWFGVGFDAVEMADQPYTLIVNSSGVMERKIGTCGSEAEHCPGDLLQSSVTIISNKVVNNVRTVVMSRPFLGATPKHHTFNVDSDLTMHFISAIGSSEIFGYHVAHAANTMTLTTPNKPVCICDAGAAGKLCETNGTHCNSFIKNCDPEPYGDLLAQKNPTCNSRQYGGGLRCCGHMRIMTDIDQEVRPELLRYHMKFRFWFQEYKPKTAKTNASHHDLPRIYYQTEAHAGEYDIPPAFAVAGKPMPGYPNWPLGKPTPGTTCTGKCPDGPDCECIHTITYHWTISNKRLIYAGGHCHAPSCLSLELYTNTSGKLQLLCAQLPEYGKGNFPKDKFDEAGYLALPPCLWGDDKGLEPTTWLGPNTHMVSIKKNRNTHVGHYGEMASWQMRGVSF